MDRGPLSEADAETLEAWLAGDPRRMGALMRARALFSRTESAWTLEPVFDRDAYPPQPALFNRRRVLAWGAGGAMAAALGTLVVGSGMMASTAYATGRGEMREVPLADGTKLTLNTLSKVEIGTYFGKREIRLVTGEILFSQAKDAKEGSVLQIEDWGLRSGGAVFFLSHLPDRLPEITVHWGAVDITGPGAGNLRLEQGCQLSLREGTALGAQIRKLSDDQLSRELSWLDGQLAFHDESLAEAVAAFARYSRQPIIIRDPALAKETVTGLFAANDPAGFARAIGTAFGVEVHIDASRILLG